MLQGVRDGASSVGHAAGRTVSDHDSLGRLLSVVTAAALTQAFIRQSFRFDLDWNDWIGYAIGMAAASSPSLVLKLIQAKYGINGAATPKKEPTP